MARETLRGQCNLCGQTFAKAAMTRHLSKCTPARASGKGTKRILHLQIEGRDLPYYWMHVEMPAEAQLKDLDRFLRDTWLECCGHLSAFHIEGEVYDVNPEPDLWTGEKPKGMSAKLGDVLQVGTEFEHEYDFGTTTELVLKVVAERRGTLKAKSARMLARNDPPAIVCERCKKKPAVWVCSVCIYSEPAWYCDDCAGKHKCAKHGEDCFLPVVNSPRVGMCGYTG